MYKIFYAVLAGMLIFIAIVAVFSLRVRLLSNNINSLNEEISSNYQDLQNLKAEWNYLNNPQYLIPEAKKYLPSMMIDNNKEEGEKLVSKIPFLNSGNKHTLKIIP